MEEFKEREDEIRNTKPYAGENMLPTVVAPSAMATSDQARSIAEVQGAMVIARANPRDEMNAYTKIMKACKRKSFAEQALFAYRRGGTLVEGETIRLAEVAARCWTNMTYGFREINRTADGSEVEAFAWDLETNTKAVRQFQVRHWRDTKTGGKEVTQERDKYELIAGMAQRRVRSCIFELIPGDIVEAARIQCNKTLTEGDGRTIEDRVRDMIEAFVEHGVNQEMIEDFLSHKIDGIVVQELVRLQKIYTSIRDGIAPASEFFKSIVSKTDLKEKIEKKTEVKDKIEKKKEEPVIEDEAEEREKIIKEAIKAQDLLVDKEEPAPVRPQAKASDFMNLRSKGFGDWISKVGQVGVNSLTEDDKRMFVKKYKTLFKVAYEFKSEEEDVSQAKSEEVEKEDSNKEQSGLFDSKQAKQSEFGLLVDGTNELLDIDRLSREKDPDFDFYTMHTDKKVVDAWLASAEEKGYEPKTISKDFTPRQIYHNFKGWLETTQGG